MSKLEYSRGEQIAGKYEVVDLLGEAPLGKRYRVTHLESGETLQLLLLDPEHAGLDRRERIIEVFQKARAARHENLLKIGELGEAEGVAYVTTEDYDGMTLAELIADHASTKTPIDVRHAAQIIRGILDGLSAVHAEGSVFRALRPEHVLVQDHRVKHRGGLLQVKLSSAYLWDLVPTTALVEDEFTRGDAQYLAPELKSFDPDATPRSDVYSAGAILYEMLVGAPPTGTFQLPRARRPDLPEHLNTVVELALAQAPGDRYTSAKPFIDDIARTFDGQDDEPERKAIMGPLGWGLALIIVVLIAFLSWALRADPVKEAEALDSQLRAQVIEDHDRPSDEEIRSVTARHPQNMIYIPRGPFLRGRLHSETAKNASRSEGLAEIVELEAYLIDAFEAPNLKGSKPTTSINYSDAVAACESQGKRLCSADEWEKACKGPRNTAYSWGDNFDPAPCGMGLDSPGVSGGRADCRSGWGAFDMSGNFVEWTSSIPDDKDTRRIVKGGLKGNHAKGGRCGYSTDASVAYKDRNYSFRCCRDVNAPPVEPEGEDAE